MGKRLLGIFILLLLLTPAAYSQSEGITCPGEVEMDQIPQLGRPFALPKIKGGCSIPATGRVYLTDFEYGKYDGVATCILEEGKLTAFSLKFRNPKKWQKMIRFLVEDWDRPLKMEEMGGLMTFAWAIQTIKINGVPSYQIRRELSGKANEKFTQVTDWVLRTWIEPINP